MPNASLPKRKKNEKIIEDLIFCLYDIAEVWKILIFFETRIPDLEDNIC